MFDHTYLHLIFGWTNSQLGPFIHEGQNLHRSALLALLFSLMDASFFELEFCTLEMLVKSSLINSGSKSSSRRNRSLSEKKKKDHKPINTLTQEKMPHL